jgi:chromosome segregation ATPase
MGNVYQSVRGVVQGTLHRRKPDIMVSARAKGNDGSLNDAMEELEKIFVDGIGRLKAAVSDHQAGVASEAHHAEQVIEGLKANITALEAKLRETEDTVHRKDVASQKMEASLSTEIRDLQSAVKEKEGALESRGSEVNDLKSKIDLLVKQLTQLELAIQQAKGEAATHAERADYLTESSKAKIHTLEAQLRQAEQIVRAKDWTIKELDQNLTAKIQNLESEMTNKDKLLADRDRQVTDLNSELKRLTNVIKEMPSFFRQAEALDTQAQDIGAVVADKQLQTGEEKPATSQFEDVGVTSNVTDAALQTVSRDAFERMIGEFGELINVIKPLASVIVRDHVAALGESIEKFPKPRLAELRHNLSQEIPNENLKTGFRERLGKL